MVWAEGIRKKANADDMVAFLDKHECHQSKHTSRFFTYESRDISFTLVVDDFGIKYKKKKDLDHLMAVLRTKYRMLLDMDAKQ